jgi:hypothetical protein
VLLRVCEAVEAPQLVGDTLHISGGADSNQHPSRTEFGC